MTEETAKKQKLLYLTSAVVLALGLASAVALYFLAHRQDETGYQVVGDFVYPNSTETSKKYVHDLEVFGGKAAVLSDKFVRWFNGLWEGETLAYTVGIISAFLSLCIYGAAKYGIITEPDEHRE